MVHLSNLIVVAASALWLSAGTNAAPTRGEKVELLLRRAITKYEDCTVEQRKKAGQAFADAATMARWTFDETLKDGREYKDTNAYVALLPLLFWVSMSLVLIQCFS